MTSKADLTITVLAAAAVPVVLFVLLQKRGAKKGSAVLVALREKQRMRRRRSASASMSSSATLTLQSMLSKVAPSPHGFLPGRVPDFSFNNTVLDEFVKVVDEFKGSMCRFRVVPLSTSIATLCCRFRRSLFFDPDLNNKNNKNKNRSLTPSQSSTPRRTPWPSAPGSKQGFWSSFRPRKRQEEAASRPSTTPSAFSTASASVPCSSRSSS